MAQTASVPQHAARITEVTADDVAALGIGTAIFGTGGGGEVYGAQTMVERELRTHGPVRLVSVDDLGPDDVVVLMSGIGAPTVGIEMLSSKGQIHALLEEAERLLGRPVTTLMAAEIGGSNGVRPIGWAAQLGLQVLDADGMGRAFPDAAMMAMNVAGVHCDWAAQSDVVGNITVMKTVDLHWLERHTRALTVASGWICIGSRLPDDRRNRARRGHRGHRERGDPRRPRTPERTGAGGGDRRRTRRRRAAERQDHRP